MDSAQTRNLQGGGEMGALMRATDWAQTALGPVSGWPQSLRTAVSILLDSRFPMYIAWGPRYVQLYNDGYRPVLGSTKHPAAMGQEASKTFAESWHIIGPMFDNVMRGVATGAENWMLPLDRHGYLEECFFTFSYSPIRDESGDPGGVHVTVSETTERVLSERRLGLLHALSERMSQVSTPEAACQSAAEWLEVRKEDVAFSLFYLLEDDGRSARLAASSGLEAHPRARPPSVPLGVSSGDSWPLADVVRSGTSQLLANLADRFGALPGGAWPEAAHCAVLQPIARPGQERPYGLLVAGVSPRLAPDTQYRNFISLLAGHLATAVTNARALADERRRREELAEIDRLKTAFFSNVSHEFRTPLTLLLGPTEDALADGGLNQADQERWKLVQRNALRLSKLVNALLDFSRIEAGRVEASYQPTRLGALTSELASMFRSAVERAGLELQLTLEPDDEPAYVDREMWEKIVLNLLSNALKFTFQGRISIGLHRRETGFELVVSDTGTGIPEEQLPFLFDRFHRVKGARSRTQEGTGIGLALLQELTKLHGGTVSVKSQVNQGTSFTVSIPRGKGHLPPERIGPEVSGPSVQGANPFVEEALRWLPPAAGDAREQPHPETEARTSEPEEARARLLLVDDNADMREYLGRLLGERWDVEVASDGMSALELIRHEPPDLVLSDVMMPGLDGVGLVRALRGDAATRLLPIILLSARAGDDATAEGLRAGANDYLVKPFSSRDLLVRIASQLATAKAAQAGRALAEAERVRLYEHFMQAPFPIAVLRGRDFVFELANPEALKVWGKTASILGQPLVQAMPELEGQPFLAQLKDVLRTGVAYEGREALARLARGPGGELEDVYFNFVYSPLRDLSGNVEGILLCGFEVSSQVLARRRVEELAESEKRARATAEEADRRKDEFVAMLAHELRNPLAAISTALGTLQREDVVAPRLARLRDISTRQVSVLVRMVDDLLDVSRVNMGKVELRHGPLALEAVVQNAVLATRAAIEGRGHSLKVSVGPGPFRMHGDDARLEQVLSNLLVNAAKYTPQGGSIVLSLERETSPDGAHAVFRVQDNGQGIPAGMLGKVFELFVQGDATLARTASGLGIGLTLVRSLVEMHGGTVEARSEGEGKGSEFVVRLPLALEQTVEPPAVGPSRPPGTREGQPRSVLLIEDSQDIRESMKEYLEDCGHRLTVAEDGLEGARRALAEGPEVALVDIGLPGIDGYEVARRVRAAPEGRALFLVALTGYGGEVGRRRAAEAGFDVQLTKPVDLEELDALIRRGSRT